jgi:hypothetical protein
MLRALIDKLGKLTHNSYIYGHCFYCFRLSELNKDEYA